MKDEPMYARYPLLGSSAIAMAIGFNLPYANLAVIFDYPDILRRPAADVLARFAEGGSALILTWHAFAWAALLLIPLSIGLALTPVNRTTSERLAVAAAISGALSGVTQAIGLWRWVFVVPVLARRHAEGDASTRAIAEGIFEMLNNWGGVAIGEHLGQLLLVFFIFALSIIQLRQRLRLTGATGVVTAVLVGIGTTEGLTLALGVGGELFSLFTIAGFLGLSAWLILIGVGQLGKPRLRRASAIS